jgi:hypothetical protein
MRRLACIAAVVHAVTFDSEAMSYLVSRLTCAPSGGGDGRKGKGKGGAEWGGA